MAKSQRAINKATRQESVDERSDELLRVDLGERVKELNCIYHISAVIAKPGVSLADALRGVIFLLPAAWQYPEVTVARGTLGEGEFTTHNFRETIWKQTSDIEMDTERIGTLEVCYLEERPESDEGPFLREERALLDALAGLLGIVAKRVSLERQLHRRSAQLATVEGQVGTVAHIVSHDSPQLPDGSKEGIDSGHTGDGPEQIRRLLSPREMEILQCLTRGLSNAQIAVSLGINSQTVKNHLTSVYSKLMVDDRTQAALHGLRAGWAEWHDVQR